MIETENEVKRITFRLSPELFSQAQAYLTRRKREDPKFSLNDLMLEALEEKTALQGPAELYRQILAVGRRQLAAFDDAELNLIMDACNGVFMLDKIVSGPLLPIEITIGTNVEDSIRLNKSDEHFGCNGPELLRKLGALNIAGWHALRDLIERFWDDAPGTGRSVREYL